MGLCFPQVGDQDKTYGCPISQLTSLLQVQVKRKERGDIPAVAVRREGYCPLVAYGSAHQPEIRIELSRVSALYTPY